MHALIEYNQFFRDIIFYLYITFSYNIFSHPTLITHIFAAGKNLCCTQCNDFAAHAVILW